MGAASSGDILQYVFGGGQVRHPRADELTQLPGELMPDVFQRCVHGLHAQARLWIESPGGPGLSIHGVDAVSASGFIYIAMADLMASLHRPRSLRENAGQLAMFLEGIGTIALVHRASMGVKRRAARVGLQPAPHGKKRLITCREILSEVAEGKILGGEGRNQKF